jgi:hypothetical protein
LTAKVEVEYLRVTGARAGTGFIPALNVERPPGSPTAPALPGHAMKNAR